jgi:hypothetical protein
LVLLFTETRIQGVKLWILLLKLSNILPEKNTDHQKDA